MFKDCDFSWGGLNDKIEMGRVGFYREFERVRKRERDGSEEKKA